MSIKNSTKTVPKKVKQDSKKTKTKFVKKIKITKVAKPTTKTTGCTHYKRFPNFKQYDTVWKDDIIIQGKTIENSGSLLSVFSMILNANGKQVNEKSITPKSLNSWLLSNKGYNKFGRLTGKWQSKFDLTRIQLSKPVNKSQLRQLVCSGKSVILKVKDGYALAVGIDDDGKTFIVNEPSYSSRNKIDESLVYGAIAYN